MKAGRIQRILKIITALQSTQKYCVNDLAKLLGISPRTVYRDLKDLGRAGVPCYFDPQNHCYTIDKEFFLASPDLNISEALGLLLSAYKAGENIPLPLREPALNAAMKIENNLDEKVKRFCSRALENITNYKEQPTGKIWLAR